MPELNEAGKNSEFDNVTAKIATEIKSLGDNTKAKIDELGKNYNELKTSMNEAGKEVNPLVQERLNKLSADVLTRQQELDVNVNKRIDSFEAAVQRLPKSVVDGAIGKEAKEALLFKTHSLAAQRKLPKDGLKATDINIDEYKKYKSIFRDYLRYDERMLNSEQMKSLSVGVDPDGGFTVTPEMSNKITEKVFEIDPIRQLARIETISTDAFEELVNFDEAGAGWASETVANSETTPPTFNKKRITAHILEARPRVTQQLVEDSSINIEQWLGNKVGERFGRAEGVAFITGDGVDKPRGIITYDSVITAGTPEFGKIEQINMGAAAALTTDGLLDVQYSLVEGVMSRASWLANRLVVRDVMKLKDGDGLYIWRPGLTEGQPSTLLGHSIRMATTLPVVAANSLSIVFADWADAYIIVDRLGISVQRDPFTVKPLIEFFTRKRVGGDVIGFDKIVIGKVAA